MNKSPGELVFGSLALPRSSSRPACVKLELIQALHRLCKCCDLLYLMPGSVGAMQFIEATSHILAITVS